MLMLGVLALLSGSRSFLFFFFGAHQLSEKNSFSLLPPPFFSGVKIFDDSFFPSLPPLAFLGSSPAVKSLFFLPSLCTSSLNAA